ncbi:MAG: type II/IV secretion system ATPase subunit [Candidatus Bathyarchaeia archaeon]
MTRFLIKIGLKKIKNESSATDPRFYNEENHVEKTEEKEFTTDSNNLTRNEKVIERYEVNPPFAFVRVVQDISRGNMTYIVDEPEVSMNDLKYMRDLKDYLSHVLEVDVNDIATKEDAKRYLCDKIGEIIRDHRMKISPQTKEKLEYYLIRDHLGYGKIDVLMRDAMIEDISCDGVNIPLYIWHRKYESIPTNIIFQTARELDSFALRLAYLCGRHVSIAQPMLDASLPDGSRLNLTYSNEVTRKGSTFSIRKFNLDPMTIVDLINYNTISAEMAAYFWYAVENRASILVSGGIAAGKTTTLNCLSMFIKPDLKIVSIEDTPELNLPHQNWIPAITRSHFGLGTASADITLFDLLQSSLRQRPDYIIVGEVRGGEAYTLFQAISTGHLGMSTIHGESVDAVVYRLESEPMNIPRTLIAGIDIITVQKRIVTRGQPCRKLVSTTEIVGLDPRSREILMNEVYRWNAETDGFDFTGRSYLIERVSARSGVTLEEASREIQKRKFILEWMAKENIRNYKDVSDMVRRYYENPETVYKEIEGN